MFSMLKQPPKKGSLQESVLLLYVLKLEEREYMRDLALAQVMVDKDAGIKKFEEYRKVMFPWIETAKARTDDQFRQMLMKEVSRGPLSVRPFGQVQSRLRKQMASNRIQSPAERKRQEDLFKGVGSLRVK
jgi:hypothetical protein